MSAMQSTFDAKALSTALQISNMRFSVYPGGEPQYRATIQIAVLEAMQWAANYQEPPIAKHGSKRDAIGLDQLVHRFLTWPVPADVYPDGTPGKPGRTGTNLLTAEQARQMLDYVLGRTDECSEAVGCEVDAGDVSPGMALYEVTYTHDHTTLKRGDRVRMIEDAYGNNTLLRTDFTAHSLQGSSDQYVHLRRVDVA